MGESLRDTEVTMSTSKCLPLDMQGLTPEMVRRAEEELKETLERKQEGLKEMRRLIYEEKDFRPIMDDAFLIKFLRTKKFRPEAAIKTLKNYYTYKVRYSGTLTDIKPSQVTHVFDLDILTVLSHRNRDGSVVGIGKIGCMDINKCSINDIISTTLIGAEIFLQSEATQICGFTIVVDLKGLSLRLVRHLASPTQIYRLLRGIQDCVPLRLKAVHVINEPFYFSMLYNVVRQFLSEKLKKRFQFHGKNLQNLHKHICPEILPEEYGGQKGRMTSKVFAKEASAAEAHFIKIAKYGFQEKRAQFIKKKSSMSLGLFL